MRRLALAAALLAGTAAFAQETGKPGVGASNGTAPAVAAAKQLVDETLHGPFVRQMAASGWPTLAQTIRARNPGISDDVLREIETAYVDELERAIVSLMEEMPQVYARYFTADELKELLAFQTSPLGRKALEVQPKIMGEVMPKMMSRLPQVQAAVQGALRERFKDRDVKI